MTGPVVMRLCGRHLGGGLVQSLPQDGQFLRAFDFEAHGGVGEIDLTPDVELAMPFEDLAAALAFRDTVPRCQPTREDGRPNRPLTSTNWEVLPVSTARAQTGSRHPAANEERN